MAFFSFVLLAVPLSLKNLWHNLRTTLLSVCLVAFGIAVLVFSYLVFNHIEQAVLRNGKGITLVVGAKGSPLQLVLSAVFQLDEPTGNISERAFKTLSKHPYIKQVIPLLYGDNIEGARLIGTNTAYFLLYSAEIEQGRIFQESMELVVGAGVAAKMGWRLGQELVSAHGLAGDEAHEGHHSFRLVGILKPTGTVLDGLAFTPPESIWDLHHGKDSSNAYTALLIKTKTPLGALNLPKIVNKQADLQAASPAQELTELSRALGLGQELLEKLGAAILFLAFLGIFFGLYGVQMNRLHEWQTLRQLGMSLWQTLMLIILEFIGLGLFGSTLGLLIGHLAEYWLLIFLEETYFFFWPKWTFYSFEAYIWLLGISLCLPAALYSATILYYRMVYDKGVH